MKKIILTQLLIASALVVTSCTKQNKKSKKSTSSLTSQSSEQGSSSTPTSSSVMSSSTLTSSKTSSSATTSSSKPTSSSPSSSSTTSSSQPIPPEEYEVIQTFSKRMPGEFEPCEMVKMCYPNNMPLEVYKTIAEDNQVLLLCNPSTSGSSRIAQARSALEGVNANLDHFTFLDMDLDADNYYWVRDFSPFYVFNQKTLGIVDFTYNRDDRVDQNAVPSKLATYFDMSYSKMNLVHTGGNLMQNGRGTAFSDDLVIDENSSESKVRLEMLSYTGTENYVITIDPQGDYIAHIDCWGKIVAPDKIIVAKLPTSNPRYTYYEQVANVLANTKCSYGYNYRIYRVEEPGGDVVAPYTNSLIANNHVYVPLGDNATYNQKALQVYQEALPGYTIHGLEGFASGSSTFKNTDALHCRTHEVPDRNMLFIDSRDVYSGSVELKDSYLVKCNVVSYGSSSFDAVKIHYSINNQDYVTASMEKYLETTNYTFRFNNLSHGDDVKYYIEVSDTSSNTLCDPTCKELDPHHFSIS